MNDEVCQQDKGDECKSQKCGGTINDSADHRSAGRHCKWRLGIKIAEVSQEHKMSKD